MSNPMLYHRYIVNHANKAAGEQNVENNFSLVLLLLVPALTFAQQDVVAEDMAEDIDLQALIIKCEGCHGPTVIQPATTSRNWPASPWAKSKRPLPSFTTTNVTAPEKPGVRWSQGNANGYVLNRKLPEQSGDTSAGKAFFNAIEQIIWPDKFSTKMYPVSLFSISINS